MPRAMGFVISKRLATLHELQTIYSSEDLWNLIEIAAVDGHNERIMNKVKA